MTDQSAYPRDDESENLTDEERNLNALLGPFLDSERSGRPVDRGALLAAHPDLADALNAFFDDYDRLQALARPLCSAVSDTLGPATIDMSAPPVRESLRIGQVSSGPDREAITGPEPAETVTGDPGSAFMPDSPTGTVVRSFGDYILLCELGRGGMGVVYKAHQVSLNRPVALKMIKAGVLADSAELSRFQNEAEAVALLDHPGIVPVYEVGDHDGQRYFSMRLIVGDNLAERITAFKDNPKAAAKLLAEAAQAVHHAHMRGILHRDLKPANILVDTECHPHVTDFGLAKRVEADVEMTATGAILGTPAYMSPEQAAGHRGTITTATDIYGLGAILYALLTGKAPFGGASIMETLDAVQNRLPESPTRLNSRVPRDLETICLKCLEKEPQRRYASVRALAEDLERWLDGHPISARPVSASVRAWMWCRRNKIVAGLLAASVLLAMGATWQWQRAEGLLSQARFDAASTAIDHALGLCEQGQLGNGLLRLARVLEREPGVATDLKQAIRTNLVAWSPYGTRLTNLLPHSEEVNFVAFGPDGQIALTLGPERTARLWDAATGEPRGNLLRHDGAIIAAAFRPDGRMAVTGGMDSRARLWEIPTGRPIGEPLCHRGPVRSVAFSQDGQLLLTGSNDGTAQVWEVATRRPIGEPFRLNGWVYEVAFGLESRVAVVGSEGGFAGLWDLRTRQSLGEPMPFHTVRRHTRPVQLLVCSADGHRILTNGDWRSGQQNSAQLFDAANGREVARMPHHGDVRAVALSRNGRIAITGSDDHTARLWDATTGMPLGSPLTHQGKVLAVALNPEGTLAVTGSDDQTARLWDVASGRMLGDPLYHTGHVLAVAFRPDGRAILTGCEDHFARLWTLAGTRPAGRPRPDEGLNVLAHLAHSPDGTMDLTGHADGTAQVRDAATAQPIGAPLQMTAAVLAVAWSPDGRMLLTGGGDGSAQVWSATRRSPISRPMIHNGPVRAVAFSPDSRMVVTSGADRTARLWDSATGKPVGPPLEHDKLVVAVGFTRGGDTILTKTEDGVMRGWKRPGDAIGPDARFVLWPQITTGSEMDVNGIVRGLNPEAWKQRRDRLEELGGAPCRQTVSPIDDESSGR